MHKWLLLLLAVLVAVAAVGCKQAEQASLNPAASPVTTQTPSAENDPACSTGCSVSAAEGEIVNVTFRLPKEATQPDPTRLPGAPRLGTPSRHVSEILGARIGGQGACVFAQINEGGLADQAGIKVGDVIVNCNGGEPDCASALDSWLYCGKEPGLVEMTLRRPSAQGASSGETGG